jgi:hypothetical protein
MCIEVIGLASVRMVVLVLELHLLAIHLISDPVDDVSQGIGIGRDDLKKSVEGAGE